MHQMVNSIFAKRAQLSELLTAIPTDNTFKAVQTEGAALVQKMKAWDEEMVQRKSKAYDDVENFPNKFTANYMFLINQTESDLPRVNQSSLDQLEQLGAAWNALKARSEELATKDIPALNKKLWDLGFGAIWKD